MTPSMGRQQLAAHVRRLWLPTAVGLVLFGLVIWLPVLRLQELHEIESTVSQSSTVLTQALQSPAIFTGQPAEARAALDAQVRQLSLLHDRLVLAHYHLAHRALQAALDYTDYTQRIGVKLLQVGDAEQAALAATQDYDLAVAQLKSSNLSNRTAAQNALNESGPKARDATELAYTECQLLSQLTREFGIAQTMALQHLGTLGPDVLAAVGALRAPLVAATAKTLEQKRRFSPNAH